MGIGYGLMKSKQGLRSEKPLKAKSSLQAKSSLKSTSDLAKPKKQHSVAKLKKEADKWHSKATRLRFAELQDGEYWADCITCGAHKPIKSLQCGHFMSRQYNILRYDELNTAPQCYGDNVMQQGKQYEFGIALDELYGAGTAARLHKQSKEKHQFTVEELQTIIKERKEEVAVYERVRA